ncbi:MAG: hypothetical protein KME13_11410 [Myxacorys californica WJT36-NPBG1]|jgi:hypothetical protein|nr:hypothetical protein [Myxacorys californica WJT36-NPBG1]
MRVTIAKNHHEKVTQLASELGSADDPKVAVNFIINLWAQGQLGVPKPRTSQQPTLSVQEDEFAAIADWSE